MVGASLTRSSIVAITEPGLIEWLLQLPSFQAGAWLLVCAIVFSVLQNEFAHDRRQPALRTDAWVDAVYWLAGPILYAAIATSIVGAGFWLIYDGQTAALFGWLAGGAGWLGALPLPVQGLLVLLVTDLYMYWCHRLFHSKALWRFHAIHHSSENLDWLSAARFHPVNYVPHVIVANALVLWMGFAPAALVMLGPFNILYSSMVHANLNWTFGPLRHVFVSPVFHRWHHTGPDEGGSNNFAPTFSFLDHAFGTFHMPEGQVPGETGIEDKTMPATPWGQLVHPFIPAADQAPLADKTKAPA
jgi:sterol desaturase/sphingolipid hydroxylase (fatty acid hydroxylase superfamily)